LSYHIGFNYKIVPRSQFFKLFAIQCQHNDAKHKYVTDHKTYCILHLGLFFVCVIISEHIYTGKWNICILYAWCSMKIVCGLTWANHSEIFELVIIWEKIICLSLWCCGNVIVCTSVTALFVSCTTFLSQMHLILSVFSTSLR